MKKKMYVLGLVLLMVVTVASGCVKKVEKSLDPGFSEETLKQSATEIIELWNVKDYDKMVARSSDSVKDKLTVSVLSDAWEQQMPKLGAFKKIEKQQVKPNGPNAIVLVVANYENGKAQYTIGFDLEMKLNNFFIK